MSWVWYNHFYFHKKGSLPYIPKTRQTWGIDSCDRPSNLTQIGFKSSIFNLCDLKFDGWPRKAIGQLFYTMSNFVHQFNPSVNSKWSYSPERLNSGQNWRYFFCISCDLEIWWMTVKNNREPLLYYVKFVHHFNAIGEFKLELQSGNAQFGSKSAIFFPFDLEVWRMTLTNNRAPLLGYFKLCVSFCSHWWI